MKKVEGLIFKHTIQLTRTGKNFILRPSKLYSKRFNFSIERFTCRICRTLRKKLTISN
jgi:hypothetical protein